MNRVKKVTCNKSRANQVPRNSCRVFIKNIYRKDREKLEKQLMAGVNVNAADYDGNTALHHAVATRSTEIIRLLIEYHADVNAENDQGFRPYNLALHDNFIEALEVLLTDDAVITEMNQTVHRLPQNISDLFYDKVDLESCDVHGRSALHVVTSINDLRAARRLLSRGAEPSVHSWYSGDTPLHIVTSCEIAELLLDYGASINAHDRYAMTPMTAIALKSKKSFSRDGEQTKIIELFVNRGADVLEVIVACELHLDYDHSFDAFHGVMDVLKFMGLREHESSFVDKFSYSVLTYFYQKVLAEVAQMKETNFYCKTNYYEFLVSSWERKMSYVDDIRVARVHGNVDNEITLKFPLYSAILRRHVDGARERNELRENAAKAITVACPRLQSVNLVVCKILMYFSRDDMKFVVAAFDM